MDQLAMLSHEWVTRLAAQYIDSASLDVVRLGYVAEQWAGIYLDDPRPCTSITVFVERTLQGS
ncbi:hypothetical protein D3C85_1658390 [compost metagenome]